MGFLTIRYASESQGVVDTPLALVQYVTLHKSDGDCSNNGTCCFLEEPGIGIKKAYACRRVKYICSNKHIINNLGHLADLI